jgi:hypothetical protein
MDMVCWNRAKDAHKGDSEEIGAHGPGAVSPPLTFTTNRGKSRPLLWHIQAPVVSTKRKKGHTKCEGSERQRKRGVITGVITDIDPRSTRSSSCDL